MILGLVLYGTSVALILALAGLAMEPLAARLGWPRRSVWASTLMLSIAAPVVMVISPHSPKEKLPVFPEERALFLQSGRSAAVTKPTQTIASPIIARSASSYVLPNINRIVGGVWLALSVGLIIAWTLSWIRLQRSFSRWQQVTVDGREIWITPTLGPAVFGFSQPQVLVPEWLMGASAEMRAVVLLHEWEHVRSRDPALFLAGLVAVVLAPWNLPLWWQLRRLRFALEVDCDERVLRMGVSLSCYGEALLDVNQHGHLAPLGAIAIAKPRSQLEHRIRIMASRSARPARWLIAVGVTFAVACVAVALELPAPSMGDLELRKPRLHDLSPYWPKAQAAARNAYPDLFTLQPMGHTVLVEVEFDLGGQPLSVKKREFLPGLLPKDVKPADINELDLIADRYQTIGAAARHFIGWSDSQHTTGLYIEYRILKWPHDPTRSASRVRAAVAMQYPEYFRADPAGETPALITKLATVFMNDGGTINQFRVHDTNTGDFAKTHLYDDFLQLGLPSEQFAHRSRTWNAQDEEHPFHYANATHLIISYAWPRRSDDLPDVDLQSRAAFDETRNAWHKEIAAQISDEVFLKRYFPDVWQNAPARPPEQLWILFGAHGEVCDSGRSNLNTYLETQVEARYPTARVTEGYASGASTANGNNTDLHYLWLDDDSPVTECRELAMLDGH